MDEVFVKISGVRHYLGRAVDQESLPLSTGYGEVIDVFLQKRRDATAAKRFFKRLFRTYGGTPRKIVTDKLGSYRVAHRELAPDMIHDTMLIGM
jgi:putative transposase